eukprot:TRINITY_DN15048_c0_g1_i1.p1 TRINITY_DN15048_c0_g1~~TRINITY_DN15048_c0_g1_i1.p1  ORF type:complete len:198 (-),score=60.96 TRINITY_DN15048_c0_g1_i1:23-616(-)
MNFIEEMKTSYKFPKCCSSALRSLMKCPKGDQCTHLLTQRIHQKTKELMAQTKEHKIGHKRPLEGEQEDLRRKKVSLGRREREGRGNRQEMVRLTKEGCERKALEWNGECFERKNEKRLKVERRRERRKVEFEARLMVALEWPSAHIRLNIFLKESIEEVLLILRLLRIPSELILVIVKISLLKQPMSKTKQHKSLQ